jgi:formylglycine-generating enzyme required for sulfatase activity
MVCIEAGSFVRGSNDGPKNERPQATVLVDTFYMDVYEVDVAHYDACVSAKKCRPAKTNYSDYSRPTQPKVGVKWFDAVQY